MVEGVFSMRRKVSLRSPQSGNGQKSGCQVHVQQVEVDLKASQRLGRRVFEALTLRLLLLSKHLGAYDPQARLQGPHVGIELRGISDLKQAAGSRFASPPAPRRWERT